MTTTDGDRIIAARSLLKWKQGDLARQSGVSIRSVVRLEHDKTPFSRSRHRVFEALQRAGIEFLPNGVRLLEPRRGTAPPQRAAPGA